MTDLVHEPGSVRRRRVNGQYRVTYWGSVDEQIAEATAANARATSSHDHRMIPLYTWMEHCGHPNPENDDRYRDVEDLADEWMRRNAPALTYRDGDLYWKNLRRAHASVPLYVEWRRAQDEWDDMHGAAVCLASPMGECCEVCADGDEDGYEPGDCRLPERVREAYDDFWWRVSPEGIADRARRSR